MTRSTSRWRRMVFAALAGVVLLLSSAGSCESAEDPGTSRPAPGGSGY